ncbi:hypothetical protein RhiirA4_466199 [Rhizophagus irregularis]|uniref:Uncharacterized protein n=1 Tax=Rhizophagus irregularis TaxID=588596 RepID=A0A2I1GTP6_9GLOM|nr:hypothetical protein RhiirA4_466199 [Rhizophagus irregularis]
MIEEENFDEISESERISLKFNEMLDCINDDTDNTSTFSDIDFEEIETFEEEVKEQEICNETDEIIDHLEQQKFTPCLIGKEVEGVLSKLRVCDSHFQFDNKYLHQSLSKNQKGFDEGIIQWRRKIFKCHVLGYKCKALHSCPNLCNRAYENIKSPQSICCLYYENLGGHIHRRSGIRGKSASTCITEKLHDDDITKGLEFIGNLLIKIAQMENNEEFGRTFGKKLWNSRLNINSKKSSIESPHILQEYYNAFPEFLNDFFSEMIDELYQQKMKICNIKRKKRHKLPKIIIPEETIKIIVTFITSILLNLTFPHLKVWLPRILASY